MKLIPEKKERMPLLWYFVSVYLLSLALIELVGPGFAFAAIGWAYAGVSLLTAWKVLPALPQTLPGHLIRLIWACGWPYYLARRWVRKHPERR
jgi:hypothetical protein